MSKSSEYFVMLFKETDRDAIRGWWRSLEEARKDRARLRRCDSPMQVMILSGFHRLLNSMDAWPQYQVPALAAVAGLLSHVQEDVTHSKDTPLPFGRQLGLPKDEEGNPSVSELRFYQIQKSRDLDELYRRLRRAVWLLGRRANILSLADCVLQWDRENRGVYDKQPSRRVQFRLAQDYFSAVLAS